MAFQLTGFQATAFQIPRQDQRRPGGKIEFSYHDGTSVRIDKAIRLDSDDEIMAIARAFVENCLHFR